MSKDRERKKVPMWVWPLVGYVALIVFWGNVADVLNVRRILLGDLIAVFLCYFWGFVAVPTVGVGSLAVWAVRRFRRTKSNAVLEAAAGVVAACVGGTLGMIAIAEIWGVRW